MGKSFEKDRVRVSKRRHWLVAIQLATPLLVPAIFWLAVALNFPAAFVVALVSAVFVAATGSFLAWLHWLRASVGAIHANADGLSQHGRVLVRRDAVRTAIERKSAKGVIVRFESRLSLGLDFAEVELETEEEARTLIDAMDLGASRSLMRYAVTRGNSRTHAAIAGAIAALTIPITLAYVRHVVPGWLALAPIFPLLIAMATQSYVVTLGADGLHVSPALGRARFISYGKIREIRLDRANVSIVLSSGETIAVSFGNTRGLRWAGSDVLLDQAATFVARVRERMTAQRQADVAALATSLARGGRTSAEWINDITRATDGAASFRDAAVPADALLAVVEDENADADVRVAAAVALRRTEADLASRDRIRIAATSCAEPALKNALETAADANDDDDWIDALDTFQAKKRAR